MNQKKTIFILLYRTSPAVLKLEMRKRINFEEDREKNLKKFIKILTGEAIYCESYVSDIKDTPKNKTTSPVASTKPKGGVTKNTNNYSDGKQDTPKKETLLFL